MIIAWRRTIRKTHGSKTIWVTDLIYQRKILATRDQRQSPLVRHDEGKTDESNQGSMLKTMDPFGHSASSTRRKTFRSCLSTVWFKRGVDWNRLGRFRGSLTGVGSESSLVLEVAFSWKTEADLRNDQSNGLTPSIKGMALLLQSPCVRFRCFAQILQGKVAFFTCRMRATWK